MIKKVNINRFLRLNRAYPIFDVRTPAEFEKGHIPGAINVPLFSNEERAIVGTSYKTRGRKTAILNGLDFVGPKMRAIVELVEASIADFSAQRDSKKEAILFHCWRGGMRSESVAWLLELYGYRAITLQKGYKSFRKYVLDYFKKRQKIIIIGGFTGSAKTQILKVLSDQRGQTIDLESNANHKGSAFGNIGEKRQPTQEHFENLLASRLGEINNKEYLWLEDESQMTGKLRIPNDFWDQMRDAPVIFLRIPRELRRDYIISEYSKLEINLLKEAILKIERKMGGDNTRKAIKYLESRNFANTTDILLDYYDKTYEYSLSKRNPDKIFNLESDTIDPKKNAEKILELAENL